MTLFFDFSLVSSDIMKKISKKSNLDLEINRTKNLSNISLSLIFSCIQKFSIFKKLIIFYSRIPDFKYAMVHSANC